MAKGRPTKGVGTTEPKKPTKQWFPNLTEEQLDEKIIHSAINFWFEDEDAGSGKVWNYFKDI